MLLLSNRFFAGVDPVDWSLLPSFDYQRRWIEEYLSVFQGGSATPNEVSLTLNQVRNFIPISHLHWGLWSVVQSIHSKIDFDFFGYAIIKLSKYFETKRLISGL